MFLPVEKIGLVLSKEVAFSFIWQYYEHGIYGQDQADCDEEYFFEAIDYSEILSCIDSFSGGIRPINEDGEMDKIYLYDEVQCKTIFVLSLSPNISANLFEKKYESYEQLISKLKNEYAASLPEDFDYESNLKRVIGVYES